MTTRVLGPLAAAALLATAPAAVDASAPATARASAHGCKDFQLGGFVSGFTVSGINCRRAKGFITWHIRHRGGFAKARRHGFHCGVVGTGQEAITYRCHAGKRAFRWTEST